jgi:hypothetical protein
MDVTNQSNFSNETPKVNWYNCIKKPQVVSTISVNSWIEKIKDSTYKEKILKARNGELDYDKTKASLPCVTYNFLFDKYKKDENMIAGTGLLYIDIDKEGLDINFINDCKLFAYYRSFGGAGYSIIVRVDGLTLDNFKATYLNIINELGISDFVDTQAIKASQFNVLSFDPDLFFNPDSFVFNATNVAPQSVVIRRKEKKAYTIDWGAESSNQINYDNLDGIEIDGDYIVNWEGYDYIKCFIQMNKVSVNRNNFLLSYCNNLVYLNPNISPERTFKILDNVNRFACAVPIDDKQLWRIINAIFKYQQDGSLKPIYFNKKRKIVFDKKSKLSREEKLDICRTEIALKKTEDSKQKLYDIIEQWDFKELGKITQRKIYQSFPITKKTVEKYWSEFKEYVNELNETVMKKQIEVNMSPLPIPKGLRDAMIKIQNKVIELQLEHAPGEKLVINLVSAA